MLEFSVLYNVRIRMFSIHVQCDVLKQNNTYKIDIILFILHQNNFTSKRSAIITHNTIQHTFLSISSAHYPKLTPAPLQHPIRSKTRPVPDRQTGFRSLQQRFNLQLNLAPAGTKLNTLLSFIRRSNKKYLTQLIRLEKTAKNLIRCSWLAFLHYTRSIYHHWSRFPSSRVDV